MELGWEGGGGGWDGLGSMGWGGKAAPYARALVPRVPVHPVLISLTPSILMSPVPSVPNNLCPKSLCP